MKIDKKLKQAISTRKIWEYHMTTLTWEKLEENQVNTMKVRNLDTREKAISTLKFEHSRKGYKYTKIWTLEKKL